MDRRSTLVYFGWAPPTPEEARTIGRSPLVRPFGWRPSGVRRPTARAVDGPVWVGCRWGVSWRRWPERAWGLTFRLGRWEIHVG